MKRVSLPVAITIGCGLIFLGLAASFLVKKGNLNRGNKPEPKETIKRTDYTEIARKTLDWIDQQRNEEGWYILGKTCGQKDCEVVWDDKKVGNKDGLIATWARLNFFEQHQDPKDLEIVKKDIDLFYDKYKDDNLSDSLWLCKITYEMAQSKYIDQGQKDKLKELCMKKEIVDFSDQSLEKLKRNLVENNDFSKGVSFSYYFLMFQNVYSGFGNVSELRINKRDIDRLLRIIDPENPMILPSIVSDIDNLSFNGNTAGNIYLMAIILQCRRVVFLTRCN